MSLYESLVGNIGIGKDAINKPFLKELRDEMCDNFQGFMLCFFTKTNFVKVHQMIAKALDWPSDRTAYIGATFRDRPQTILRWCMKKPGGLSTQIAIFAVNDDNFYVIGGVEDFKKVYKKLDDAFKTYAEVDSDILTDMIYRVSPDYITKVPMRKYNIKDAKGSLKELLK